MPEPTSPNKPSVYLETFGCQMNVLDSQLVQSQLQAAGYQFINDWQAADVILYNTCSVREHAEQKVWSRLGIVAGHKKNRPEVVLGVIGCMAERQGGDMLRQHPYIDLLCGPGELDKVPLLIDNAKRTRIAPHTGRRDTQMALQGNTHRRSGTLAAAADQLEMLDLSRSFSPDLVEASAYVRITRGCNKFCTYCVVPNTRGAEVHRAPDHIVEECRQLVDAGAKEITLLGQTVNHYHYDLSQMVTVQGVQQPQVGAVVGPQGIKERTGSRIFSFADLLARIHDEIPRLPRLRFVTNYPRDFGDDILRVIAARPRICRYLHLPVQSGSDRILKRMNRDYSVAEFRDLLRRVRDILPDAQIASDLICGFPGETEDDHRLTCDLLEEAGFKNCFIFKYSPRPDTAAIDRFADDVPDEVKRRRNNELLAIQSQVSDRIHQAHVGKTLRVFVESISAKAKKNQNEADPSVTLGWQAPTEVTQLTGRTDGDLIVMFEADPSLIGRIVEVRIDRAAPLALFGELAGTPATV